MYSTSAHDDAHLRAAWPWAAGAPERIEVLDRLADSLSEYLAFDRAGAILRDDRHFQASERLWSALLDVLDLAADDLRARRAKR